MNPPLEIHNILNSQALTQTDKIDLADFLALLLHEYPDLAAVIQAWPGLNDTVRRDIMKNISVK